MSKSALNKKTPSPRNKSPVLDKTSKDLEAEAIRRLWEHGLHEDTMFNDRLNFFLIFESVLLGVVGMLYGKQPPIMKPILLLLGFLGLFITIIWGYVQSRQRSTLQRLIDRLQENLPEFRETYSPLDQKRWRRISGTWLLTYLIPFLVALIWIALLILFAQQ